MKQRFVVPIVVASLLAVALPVLAAPVPFTIDPTHSQVSFAIRHFFTRVYGRFNDFSGSIMLDEQNLANSSVEATIQAASIFTANEKRDKHLRSADFFAVDSIPTITFKSTKVSGTQGGKLTIEGNLTVRGVTRPVVLEGTMLGAGALDVTGSYSAGYRAGFEATTTINRKDFNVTWNRTLDQGGTMLGDDVVITVGVEAIREEPKKAATAPASQKK